VYILDIGDTPGLRSLSLAGSSVLTIAGGTGGGFADGTGTAAKFNFPKALTLDTSLAAPIVYIADSQNHRVRRVDAATGAVTTLAGTGSAGYADSSSGVPPRFNLPHDREDEPLCARRRGASRR
jgi:hypothetical protein